MATPDEGMYTRLDETIGHRLTVINAPGVAIGLTNSRELLHVGVYGHAEIASQRPVQAETLFQIGSISKSFASIALLRLQEQGILNVHDPVSTYLPWFEVRSNHGPVTLHHLLTHTAGLVRGSDEAISAFGETWNLRFTESGAPPGEFYHYSNTGYKALGLVLEACLERHVGEILHEFILSPLGMHSSEAAITHATRHRLAVGYVPYYDDRPLPSAGALTPAPWFETDTADGSISATAADMCRYLRMLLNRGAGLISPQSFAALTSPYTVTEDGLHGEHYGYGLNIQDLVGHQHVGHSGGMVGYTADMLADLDAGLGVVVLTNGLVELQPLTRYVLDLLRAAVHREELPLPTFPDPFDIDCAPAYSGEYTGANRRFHILAEGQRLYLHYDGQQLPMERLEPDTFYVQHPDFELFAFHFGWEAEAVVEAFHGSDWYVNQRYRGETSHPYPPAWNAYPGHYRAHNPWYPNFRVILRKGRLWLSHPWGEEIPLEPLSETVFRAGADPRSPERLRFDLLHNGQAERAYLSGGAYSRTFTP